MMGFLDAFAGFLSCVGGAFVGGAIQSLMNQTTIPITLLLSKIFLGSVYRRRQNIGSAIIVVGAICSVLPSLLPKNTEEGNDELNSYAESNGIYRFLTETTARSATTFSGVVVYFFSIIPGGFSNVYKEYAFKESENPVDVYYMTTWVAFFQVVLGFVFLPAQLLPGLGSLTYEDILPQLRDGWMCMLGYNPLEGDQCEGAGFIMVVYVAVNFVYNIFSLLVVKHGSANLSVIAAAVALPLTNMSFSWKFLMGADYEPFDYINLVSTAIVLAGFLTYSTSSEKKSDASLFSPRTAKAKLAGAPKGKTLGLASAGGSVMYIRPRADSDPTTPFYTPLIAQGKREKLQKDRSGYNLENFKFWKSSSNNSGRGDRNAAEGMDILDGKKGMWADKKSQVGYGAVESGEFKGPESL